MCEECEQQPRSVVTIDTDDGGVRFLCEGCAVLADETSENLDHVDLGAYALAQEFFLDPMEVFESKAGKDVTYADVAATLAAI